MKRPRPASRKSLKIRKDLIERVRSVLGTRGDKETVEAALDMVLFKWEVTEGLRELAGPNTLIDIYDELAEPVDEEVRA